MTPAEFYKKHAPTGTDRWAEGARETFAHDLTTMLNRYGVIQPLPNIKELTGPYEEKKEKIMKRPEKPWKILNDYASLKTTKTVFVGLTRESLAAFKAAEKAWINEQLTAILTRRAEAFEMVRGLEKSGFFRLKVGRTALATKVMEFYNGASTPGERYTAPEERWLAEQERMTHDEAVQKNVMAYRDKAVCWLIARAKRYGHDFTAEGAIGFAEQIAFEEEVARAKGPEGMAHFWHTFEGQNCEGPCLGWNGIDRRCQCGNRRVSWTQAEGHTFERPSIYAEAY